jgi:hypothetical protein
MQLNCSQPPCVYIDGCTSARTTWEGDVDLVLLRHEARHEDAVEVRHLVVLVVLPLQLQG